MDNHLIEAYRIARRYFPSLESKDLFDAIDLCRNAGGLYVAKSVSIAFFRYHPGQIVDGKRMFEIVNDWDIDTLRDLDLSTGPCVHVMFFSSTAPAYKTFRQIIGALNCQAVSCHRLKKNGARHFSFRTNKRTSNAT